MPRLARPLPPSRAPVGWEWVVRFSPSPGPLWPLPCRPLWAGSEWLPSSSSPPFLPRLGLNFTMLLVPLSLVPSMLGIGPLVLRLVVLVRSSPAFAEAFFSAFMPRPTAGKANAGVAFLVPCASPHVVMAFVVLAGLYGVRPPVVTFSSPTVWRVAFGPDMRPVMRALLRRPLSRTFACLATRGVPLPIRAARLYWRAGVDRYPL